MRRIPRGLAFVLALALVGLVGPPAHAALIASDDFEDYAPGSALTGQSGGSGWSGAWSAHATQVTVESDVISGYGKSLQIATSGTNDNIAVRQFPTQTGTVYVGFLLRTVGGWDSGDFLQFYFNTSSGASQDAGVSAGVRNTTDSPYFARVDGTGNSTNSLTAFHLDGAKVPVILKLTNTGTAYTRVDVFIGGATEAVPEATETRGSGGSSLSYFHVRTYTIESGQQIYLDALRIATTYEEAMNGIGITTALNGAYLNLTSLTLDTPAGRETFSPAQLTSTQVVHLKSTNQNNILLPGGVSVPAPGSRATLLEDLALNTGIINPGFGTGLAGTDPVMNDPDPANNTPGLGITFSQPVINRPGPDVVIFEIDAGAPDPFVVSPISYHAGLSDRSIQTGDYFLVDVGMDLQDVYGASSPIDSLAELESLGFGFAVGDLTHNLYGVALDLSDLGYLPGEAVPGLFFQSLDSANLFDPVLIVGLTLVPEPGTLALLGAGLLALAGRARRRVRR